MKLKHCSWCDNQFETSVSYQIYCSVECRESATKEKIAQRYAIKKRSQRHKRSRKCKACGTRLSAYNDDSLCTSCIVNPLEVNKALREIRGMASGKSSKDKPQTD